jgi:hypothetical protein
MVAFFLLLRGNPAAQSTDMCYCGKLDFNWSEYFEHSVLAFNNFLLVLVLRIYGVANFDGAEKIDKKERNRNS